MQRRPQWRVLKEDSSPPHKPKGRHPHHTLTQDKYLNGSALTDAGKALLEQRFRELEANSHPSGAWKEAKVWLMAPSKW
jgi:hypothetical protein